MSNFNWIDNGSVTSTPGFKACGVTAGLKKSGNPDMALVLSDVPANFAGVFTSCVFAAAPALGKVYMYVLRFVKIGCDPVAFCNRAHIGVRNLCRLLHHVAE